MSVFFVFWIYYLQYLQRSCQQHNQKLGTVYYKISNGTRWYKWALHCSEYPATDL